MYMSKAYPVVEARRQLPRLIEAAAAGRGPIFIGRRGRAEVALVAVADCRTPAERRPLAGLVRVDDAASLAKAEEALRALFDASLSATEEHLLAPKKRPRTRKSSR